MQCAEALRVQAYFDHEVDAVSAADLERHVERVGAVVRHVLYLSRPFRSDAAHSPVELAKLYLTGQASLFDLDPLSLAQLGASPLAARYDLTVDRDRR